MNARNHSTPDRGTIPRTPVTGKEGKGKEEEWSGMDLSPIPIETSPTAREMGMG